ncbi:MAG: DNA-methyltransferase [Chloroflexota bacterium]|jgi:DNA modification methylase
MTKNWPSNTNNGEYIGFEIVSDVKKIRDPNIANILFLGDNLTLMRSLPGESIDLIYADPPFFSGRNYQLEGNGEENSPSFRDIWPEGITGYLAWLVERLREMKRLLKPTGSMFLHLDWHAVHYVKVEMDRIFGYDHLQNEIIWSYRSGGGSRRRYGRKHDTLLWYTASLDGYVFNVEEARVPYDAVIAPSRQKLFHEGGKVAGSVWDISRPPNHSAEWTGYPTQKPEILLERIVKVHTIPGQVVADFFCGSGTTPAVAQRLGRRWIACDCSSAAIEVAANRLARIRQRTISVNLPSPDFVIER